MLEHAVHILVYIDHTATHSQLNCIFPLLEPVILHRICKLLDHCLTTLSVAVLNQYADFTATETRQRDVVVPYLAV